MTRRKNMRPCSVAASVCVAIVGLIGDAAVGVNVETVLVGDPGNEPDPQYHFGSVSYAYNIGKYEVTAGQYAVFLNAVAGVDTLGLYSAAMANTTLGCGIRRAGLGTVSNPYTYTVVSGCANRPVNYMGFWNTCRFANWLHNGQPKGLQGAGTTETGAYTLTKNAMDNNTVTRNPNWRWAVTSENEWYKAAYYKGGSTHAGYWALPTSSDAEPGRDLADVSGNNANYYIIDGPGPYPIDSGNYTTVVGQFMNSDGPYGTFDQGGNVWEWNDTVFRDAYRVLRGGSFYKMGNDMHSWARNGSYPTVREFYLGFRVSKSIPGDFDGDGDVDSPDLDLLTSCLSGPAVPYAQGCGDRDLDDDGDVDQSDFGIFQRCYEPRGVLAIVEPDGFASTGYLGGSFTPPGKTYTLTNTGGVPITWSAVTNVAWLTVSPTGGTLAAGASDTVEVSIGWADNLDFGMYRGTVTLTNTTNHVGDTTRVVDLTVDHPTFPSAQP